MIKKVMIEMASKKYEYKKVRSADIGEGGTVSLDQLGQDGWAFCGMGNLCWILRREISNRDVHIGLLVSCAYMRGVGNLQHRTIAEFAQFVEDVMSDKPEYQKYRFDWNNRDAIEVWIEKFNEYCKELYNDIMKRMREDDVSSGE